MHRTTLKGMLLNLEHHERIEVCTADNRFMYVRCNKLYDSVPILELLPRLRYLLRVQPISVHEFSTSSLFFTHGVLIVPKRNENGIIHSVVAMNMGDKVVRVYSNMDMSHDNLEWSSPGHSQVSSPGESPERQQQKRDINAGSFRLISESEEANTVQDYCIDTSAQVSSTQQSPHSEMSLYHLDSAPDHF